MRWRRNDTHQIQSFFSMSSFEPLEPIADPLCFISQFWFCVKTQRRTCYVGNLPHCAFSSQVAYKKRERAQKRKEMEVMIVVNIFDTVFRFFFGILNNFFMKVRVYQTQAIVCWWKHFLGSDEGQPAEHLNGSRDSNKVDQSQWSNQPNKFTIFQMLSPSAKWNDGSNLISWKLYESGVRVKTTCLSWTSQPARTALRRTTSTPSLPKPNKSYLGTRMYLQGHQ